LKKALATSNHQNLDCLHPLPHLQKTNPLHATMAKPIDHQRGPLPMPVPARRVHLQATKSMMSVCSRSKKIRSCAPSKRTAKVVKADRNQMLLISATSAGPRKWGNRLSRLSEVRSQAKPLLYYRRRLPPPSIQSRRPATSLEGIRIGMEERGAPWIQALETAAAAMQ
jgi:hypothetical protein